jgi:hypothetical protein
MKLDSRPAFEECLGHLTSFAEANEVIDASHDSEMAPRCKSMLAFGFT